MDDAYNANLWDIQPLTQVAGFGRGVVDSSSSDASAAQLRDTVIIDGFRAAKVRWKSFTAVYLTHRISWTRILAGYYLNFSGVILFIGILLMLLKISAGIFLIVLGLLGCLAAPEALYHQAGGKKWCNQPWLFGIEGYCDIGTLESKIFVTYQGHLKWSAFGSPLSRHRPDGYGDVLGVDPMTFQDVRDRAAELRSTKQGRVIDPNPCRMPSLTLSSSSSL